MSQPVTLFCGYSKEENRTTNYCLVILKMLYHENPKLLSDALGHLTGTDLGERVDVCFRQQEVCGASTPDGLISCAAYTVFVETKTHERLRGQQLENHLSGLNENEFTGIKKLIVLTNFEGDEAEHFQRIHEICRDKYGNSVEVKRVFFGEFLGALKRQNLPPLLANVVEDFQHYLHAENLLPSWERQLFAVSCPESMGDLFANAYLCMRTWDKDRCKFFGLFDGENVKTIAMIEARVDIEKEGRATLHWQNVPGDEADFITRAHFELNQARSGVKKDHRLWRDATRVFLLGPFFETSFRKEWEGHSREIFDVGYFNVSGAEALADEIRGMVFCREAWISEAMLRKLNTPPKVVPVRFGRNP